MPITQEEFKEKLISIVQAHYAAHRTPLLLARLGTELDKADAWPAGREQRNLKQLITDLATPDVDLVWDKRSPAYIAVATPDVRDAVISQVKERLGVRSMPVRLEDIARPVLLAFCIDAHGQPVVSILQSAEQVVQRCQLQRTRGFVEKGEVLGVSVPVRDQDIHGDRSQQVVERVGRGRCLKQPGNAS